MVNQKQCHQWHQMSMKKNQMKSKNEMANNEILILLINNDIEMKMIDNEEMWRSSDLNDINGVMAWQKQIIKWNNEAIIKRKRQKY